jgi:hypothetical protein
MAVVPAQNHQAEEARRAAEQRRQEQQRAEERRRAEEQKRAEQQRKAEQARRALEQAQAQQSKLKDRACVSPEARAAAAPAKSEAQQKEETFQSHLRAVEDNFKNIDDRGHDDQDGTISRDDINSVASGDYDRDEARERLVDDGLSTEKADQEIARMEEAARYFEQNDSEWERLESAGHSDGDTDDKMTRQDIDALTTERQTQELDARQRDLEAGKVGGPSMEQVRKSYAKFDTEQELSEALDTNSDLTSYSEADRRALAARAANDPAAAARLNEVAQENLMEADSLEDLDGLGMQQLVQQGAVGNDEATQKLQELAAARVDSVIDTRLDGRRGDDQAEGGLERVQQDLRALALDNPVLAKEIAAAAESNLGGREDQIEDIRRADDNFLQDVGNGIKDGTSFVGDRVRDLAELSTEVDFLPHSLAPNALKLGGAALDAAGADGLGEKVSGAGEFIDHQQDNFIRGFGEGAAGTVESLGQIVRNPLETAKGVGALAQDPSLLLDGYKETLDKHGVAGLFGQAAFEIVGTKGAGAALKKVGEVGTIAQGLDKLSDSTAVSKIAAANAKLDDIKTAGFTQVDETVTRGIDANPSLRVGVDMAKEKVDVLTGKLDQVKQLAGDRLEALTGHQVISAQQGAAPDNRPVSQRVHGQVDQYGSQAGDAAEAREQEQELTIQAALKDLFKSILGAAVA